MRRAVQNLETRACCIKPDIADRTGPAINAVHPAVFVMESPLHGFANRAHGADDNAHSSVQPEVS